MGHLAVRERMELEKRAITFSALLRDRIGQHMHGEKWAKAMGRIFNQHLGERIGRQGVEKTYENKLRGQKGVRYLQRDSICIWVFKSRMERNQFMDETIGMLKKEREDYYLANYK